MRDAKAVRNAKARNDPGGTATPLVFALSHEAATDVGRAGAKAANLARCGAAGLPVVPGFVLGTDACARGCGDSEVAAALRAAWEHLGADRRLVVRSSSMGEDASESSMAGQFTSVLDVTGWSGLLCAVERVRDSARHTPLATVERPMAVLVQPQLDVAFGGVLFGVDPVSGDRHHLAVDVVQGGPDSLVSGRATAAHFVLGRRGRVLERVDPGGEGVELDGPTRHRLAGLARAAARRLGGPQDIEWAVDRDGALWLLQSRPITATAEGAGSGWVFGTGPISETFPHPLPPLAQDVWIEPLRQALVRALLLSGVVPQRRIAASPVCTTVGGWAAIDLDLLGIATSGARHPLRHPFRQLRRLGAAWRVGRLRAALPTLAEQVVRDVDRALAAVPRVTELSVAELVELVDRMMGVLATVHTHELVAGMLVPAESDAPSAPALALAALASGRAAGRGDADIVADSPIVLALTPPSFEPIVLPPHPSFPGQGGRRRVGPRLP